MHASLPRVLQRSAASEGQTGTRFVISSAIGPCSLGMIRGYLGQSANLPSLPSLGTTAIDNT